MKHIIRNFVTKERVRLTLLAWRAEDGMTTAEYAIGTIAAASFAGILIAVVKSGGIQSALTSIIQQALTVTP